MHRLRVAVAGAFALLAGLFVFAFAHGRSNAAQSACGETAYSSNGVSYQVLFARNGAVQQYILQQSSHNTERDHDVLELLESKYGPEGVNAPPLQIKSFRSGDGGMMIPDKAVDSCGRLISFK